MTFERMDEAGYQRSIDINYWIRPFNLGCDTVSRNHLVHNAVLIPHGVCRH